MLSDDITNLCRTMFLKANGMDPADPMQGYLMHVAGRLHSYREQIVHLERAAVPETVRLPVVIDLTADKVVRLPVVKRPVPDEDGAA